MGQSFEPNVGQASPGVAYLASGFGSSISGGAPTAFTVLPPSGSADAGDEVAWQVGSNVYLQDAGGCGYQYLAELNPDHTTTPVTVPAR